MTLNVVAARVPGASLAGGGRFDPRRASTGANPISRERPLAGREPIPQSRGGGAVLGLPAGAEEVAVLAGVRAQVEELQPFAPGLPVGARVAGHDDLAG